MKNDKCIKKNYQLNAKKLLTILFIYDIILLKII